MNFREDTDHTGEDRVVLVRGTDEQAQQAELMIRKILSDIPPIIEEVFYVHQRALGRIIGKPVISKIHCYSVTVKNVIFETGSHKQKFDKIQFYCVNTSYPMDNCLSGRRRPARQTSEKDVLCLHRQVGP